jgi:transcriptional regulator with XRE-family HTH domain
MSTKFRAGERLFIIRELLGLTREEFSDQIGIKYVRINNVEKLTAKANEEDFAQIGIHLPELLPFFAYEADIELDALKKSDSALCRLIAEKIESDNYFSKFDFKDKIKHGS